MHAWCSMRTAPKRYHNTAETKCERYYGIHGLVGYQESATFFVPRIDFKLKFFARDRLKNPQISKIENLLQLIHNKFVIHCEPGACFGATRWSHLGVFTKRMLHVLTGLSD